MRGAMSVGLSGLRRAVIVLPIAWTGAWLAYYAYTDTLRRSHIRERNKLLAATVGEHVDYSKPATETEKEALKRRFASLKFAGRYWNPYVEWREQGAWEWALWKMVISTVTLKIFHYGGVPPERPIPDLPIERPNFSLLFGPGVSGASGTSTPISASQAAAEKGDNAVVRTQVGGEDVDVTDKLTMTWLGQSTSYVTLDSLAILTDPALSDRTIPSRLAPQRLRPAPCTLDELRRVDVVLVSHNHYDHLDPEAVKELGDSCEWVVPIGVGDYLRTLGVTRVKELDWWEETKHVLRRPGQKDRSYTITAVPLMHWSARSPMDTNATLWSAFHVKSDGDKPRSFIHLGDTGYSPTLFHAVGRVLGEVDLAAIPIGSYEPRWHLHLQHTDPREHDEAYYQPPVDLDIARKKLQVSEEAFQVLPVGKTMVVE
ncbi:hypothetical protein EHS25_000177 [Saitozyma podzolica]|uniref:Metallo-beta-lactamase domain-containing protein n=1 Tax=Saitozyma podzolica TaxID=1890683 RepID=A0A427YVQ5_9TREE|nr:hypothetical protein EHS25_000177 [Saitozyma podzolica]